MHTKGPWISKEVETSVGRAFKINTPDHIDDEYGVVACIYDDSTSLNKRAHDEHEANARLIEATPVLLEACEDMAFCIEECSECEGTGFDLAAKEDACRGCGGVGKNLSGDAIFAALKAQETIRKAKRDSIDDLVVGLERSVDLFDDIQERKAKGGNDGS